MNAAQTEQVPATNLIDGNSGQANLPANHPLNIVHIVERLAPGGIETLVLDLAKRASPRHSVISLQGSADELLEQWPALRQSHVSIDGVGRRGFDPAAVARLWSRLVALRPAAVFTHHIGPLVYGGLAARLARVKRLIHVEHDAWHYENSRDAVLGSFFARLLRPQVIAVSEQVAAATRAIMPGRPVTVIPPGVDTDRFQPGDRIQAKRNLSILPERKVVGAVGRLNAIKNHSGLIEALPSLSADVDLVIVGDGPERSKLEMLSQRLGVEQRVRFLGHRDDLELIYPAFDVLCQPSHAEGLPRTVLEAQSCNVPVAAANVGGLSEAVCARSGILFESKQPAALVAALTSALLKTNLISPRDFVSGAFSLAKTLQDYEALAGAR